MILRLLAALIAVYGLRWAWTTGRIGWLVAILVIYVIWMWVRIPLERSQRRAKMRGFTETTSWRNR